MTESERIWSVVKRRHGVAGSALGSGKFRERWGSISSFLEGMTSGDAGRHFPLIKEKPTCLFLSFPLSLGSLIFGSSSKHGEEGDTLGETSSNLPPRSSPGPKTGCGCDDDDDEGSLSSFLRPKTFDKNVYIARSDELKHNKNRIRINK